MSDTAYIALSIILSLTCGLIGWKIVHRRIKKLFWNIFAVPLGISLILLIAAMTADGWDAIGYLALMIFGSLPAATAMILGGGIGMVTRPQLALPS